MRPGDWATRMLAAIEDKRHVPFEWGKNDCALFAADIVAAITGKDFGKPYRGQYSNRDEAMATLKRCHWSDLSAMVDAHLARSERPRRGDVVLVRGEEGDFLGIHLGQAIAAPGDKGLTLADTLGIITSWKVD